VLEHKMIEQEPRIQSMENFSAVAQLCISTPKNGFGILLNIGEIIYY